MAAKADELPAITDPNLDKTADAPNLNADFRARRRRVWTSAEFTHLIVRKEHPKQ